MPKVNFRTSDFRRQVSDAGDLILKNRYFEENPFLTDDGAALLSRPGLRRLKYIGPGPIRGIGSEAGAFNGDLFVASGANLYRMNNTLSDTLLASNLFSPQKGFVSMAVTAQIGSTPEFLFVADGQKLQVYIANGYATGTLTGTPANNDVIHIDSVYYQFTNASVNAGSPAGTLANPWKVAVGGTALTAFTNLYNAVNGSGAPGTDYSTSLIKHPTVDATSYTATTVKVRALALGALGNTIVTTETGAALAWGAGTLTGGGSPIVIQVQMPEDVGVIDVAVIASYVIVLPVQTNGYQGRFYWINPGEISVDPLNFATAERSPDGVYGIEVFGDQFWLPGESTTEVWFPTGDPDIPMRRLQGIVLDRGSWFNTASAIHETLVVVDADGGVFTVQGGSPQRVSTPDIEEEIRKAISTQQGFLY